MKTLMDCDRKISRLSYRDKKTSYPVQEGSSLLLVHHKNSKRFIWKTQFPLKSKKYIDVGLGKWDKNLNATLKTFEELRQKRIADGSWTYVDDTEDVGYQGE